MHFLILIFLSLSLTSCPQDETTRAELALGTVCFVTLYDNAPSDVFNNVFSRIREIDNRMSAHIPSSDISRVNAAAGIAPEQVHDDTFKVIERALYFAEISGGAFDPTVGPIVSLWGFGGDELRVPSHEEIDLLLPLVNWQLVEIDTETKSVFLKHKGMALDLGAIAKGYAADEAARIIINAGIKRAIIDLGGNVFVIGEKKNNEPWKVGIQIPDENRGASAGLVLVKNKTVVTSGVYQRFFKHEEKRYHHIFDPSTGYPVENGLLSATIITGNSMDADALSTVVFVLGAGAGSAILEQFPNTQAIFIFEDKTIQITGDIDFTLLDKTYSIK